MHRIAAFLLGGLLALAPLAARADMFQDASNAALPAALNNLGLGVADTPTLFGLNLRPTGFPQGLNILQSGGGIKGGSNANHSYNQINIAADDIYLDPATATRDSLNSALFIGNTANTTGLKTGGFQTLWVRGELNKPTPAGNRNRNYVAVTAEVVSTAGDGGQTTTLAANAAAAAATVTVTDSANIHAGDGITIRLDSGLIHKTSVSGEPVGSVVTLVLPLTTAATSGNAVYVPKGGFFGINPFPQATAASQNLLELTGGEVNISAALGSSVYYKAGLTITASPTDKVAGQMYDAALSLSNQGGAVGWNHGILYSYANGAFPLRGSGTLIGIDRNYNVPSITNGIDLLHANITNDVLVHANGAWKGTGALGLGNSALNPTALFQVGAAPTYTAVLGLASIRTDGATNKYGLVIENGSGDAGEGGLVVYGRSPVQLADLVHIGGLAATGHNLLNVVDTEAGSGSGALIRFRVAAGGGVHMPSLPASAGAGGLAVCVDTAGVLYKKAACP